MALDFLIWLSSPITLLVLAMAIGGWHRAQRVDRKPEDAARIVKIGPAASDGVGAAMMFLSMAYRPNLSFIAKAQIVEREDQDEDDEGGPDTAKRHLARQLRRIRRGEPVERLVWRLE